MLVVDYFGAIHAREAQALGVTCAHRHGMHGPQPMTCKYILLVCEIEGSGYSSHDGFAAAKYRSRLIARAER